MGLSTSGEADVLNAILTGRYVSLHTGDPGNTGASEVTGGAYARQAFGAYTITGGNPSEASNDATIEYPVCTVDWGTITHFGIWTASTAGTFKGGKALNANKTVTVDDVFRFLAGTLVVTTDDV